MVNARASWCNSTGSKSKQHDNVLMQNWNVILLNLISFLHLVAPAERFLYGCYWDPTPERRVPWGYIIHVIEWKYGLQAVWTIPHFIIFNFFSLHIHTIGMVMVVTISTLCTDAKWLQSLFASLTLFIHVLCSRRHHYILWSGHLDTRCRKNKGGLDKLQNNQITLYAYLMEKKQSPGLGYHI